jgi:MHS family alpha-ketoglutarate permease-like MFS transporter
MLFAVGSALFAGPGLALLSANFWLDVLLVTIGMALVSLFSGTVAAVMAEQFPADVRATGVSLPYAISVTLFGGTTPWVITTLTHAGWSHLFWIYVAVICAISFTVFALMPESYRKVLA